jgi:hypothetical protein
MGLTAAAVEISDGEVGDLVAEHFEKDSDRRCCELRRQANDAVLEVDSAQRPAKPVAPLDAKGLLEALQPPAARTVSQQTLDIRFVGPTTGRHHAQDANISPAFGELRQSLSKSTVEVTSEAGTRIGAQWRNAKSQIVSVSLRSSRRTSALAIRCAARGHFSTSACAGRRPASDLTDPAELIRMGSTIQGSGLRSTSTASQADPSNDDRGGRPACD